jgi:hypothetical protein
MDADFRLVISLHFGSDCRYRWKVCMVWKRVKLRIRNE